jgi:thiosulfate/3-mercaptopyruvate sulfurtransferase
MKMYRMCPVNLDILMNPNLEKDLDMIAGTRAPSTLECAELAAQRSWRVFDCRHVLTGPDKGTELYAAGHIPGALHAHLDRDLAGPKTGTNGRHPLPSADVFARWLGQCGLTADDSVVAYDDSGGVFAARLWWMLRWIGHRRVAVLNGGFAAWTSGGFPVDRGRPAVSSTVYVPHPNDALRVTLADVAANLVNPRLQLVDARAANRFAGRDETLDPIGGHIPGAINRPYLDNLDESGRFKPAEQLRTEFTNLLGATLAADVVHQCGSGVTACHNLLAMERAGMGGSLLYPGSWSEWCSDPSRPMVASPQST